MSRVQKGLKTLVWGSSQRQEPYPNVESPFGPYKPPQFLLADEKEYFRRPHDPTLVNWSYFMKMCLSLIFKSSFLFLHIFFHIFFLLASFFFHVFSLASFFIRTFFAFVLFSFASFFPRLILLQYVASFLHTFF